MNIPWLLTPVLVVWALWRPLRASFSRRFAIAYPDLAPKLRLALGLTSLPLVAVYVFLPGWVWLTGVTALTFIALERMRARPSWGQRRRLPPGSLGLFPETWSDDRFYLRQAGKFGPIFKSSNFLRPTICVVGLEQGIQLLREHEQSLETPWLPFAEFVPGGMLRYMHEPQHAYYRSVFRRALAPKIIGEFDAMFTENIKRTLSRVSKDCAAGKDGINPLPYLEQMMLELWFSLFFAVERESPGWERLVKFYPLIDIANPARASANQIRNAVAEIRAVVEDQVSGWRGLPPPCLLGAILKEDPALAEDHVVMGNLIYMLTTTAADMSALLCWIIKMASDHPALLERIAVEPRAHDELSQPPLVERFVMETLRMRQSEFIYRAVVRDFNFAGYRFPSGWLLRICVWESHRDPAVFPDPDRFDPDRFLNRSFTRSEYSPFGASTHACLAPFLVTTIARIFTAELVNGFTLSCPADTPVELASSRHWAPGSAFRILIRPRG
ncbi:cytochrome P450 [uncultured Gimesia sp.]|uniref:cytochrome P450 n=1 Tax=uncultured Gimesia sp. TaxID=1678688 RepID=UPI00260476DC|nr:cytochrome P450 [uncultured Gimesia sp.]